MSDSAFPGVTIVLPAPGEISSASIQGAGLTKRELFAAMALQGLIANHEAAGTPMEMAKGSLEYADALLVALNKPSTKETAP